MLCLINAHHIWPGAPSSSPPSLSTSASRRWPTTGAGSTPSSSVTTPASAPLSHTPTNYPKTFEVLSFHHMHSITKRLNEANSVLVVIRETTNLHCTARSKQILHTSPSAISSPMATNYRRAVGGVVNYRPRACCCNFDWLEAHGRSNSSVLVDGTIKSLSVVSGTKLNRKLW